MTSYFASLAHLILSLFLCLKLGKLAAFHYPKHANFMKKREDVLVTVLEIRWCGVKQWLGLRGPDGRIQKPVWERAYQQIRRQWEVLGLTVPSEGGPLNIITLLESLFQSTKLGEQATSSPQHLVSQIFLSSAHPHTFTY